MSETLEAPYYLRTACPAQKRAALQRHLHETSDIVSETTIHDAQGLNEWNIVVTLHPTEFLATNQAKRINSDFNEGFEAEAFDSLEAAMGTPSRFDKELLRTPPLAKMKRATGGTTKALCRKIVASTQRPCILTPLHGGNCRSK